MLTMQLDEIRKEKERQFTFKNIAPLKKMIDNLPEFKVNKIEFHNAIEIDGEFDENLIYDTAKKLMPWRKGPFRIGKTFIDSEWQSFIKYNLLEKHINLENKIVADVGCNNGYYMFRMLSQNPKKVIGFDPMALFKLQFEFINHFIKSEKLKYELLGVEHLPLYEEKFDTIFCLGVLYHRSNPITMLKQLKQSLNKGGEAIIDTFIIESDEDIALCPNRYAKMRNVYFIPSISALKNWAEIAKFKEFEVLEIKPTDLNEQRKTEWIEGESLNNFLNEDGTKTIEGYPPPIRAYVRLKV
jgi:tRNA (mo5U34)-methyltransferase